MIACALLLTLTFGTTNSAQAQQGKQTSNVGQIVSGLINVNVGAINVNAVDLVDVNNVLNDNDVRILDNILNHSPILSNNSDILTNLLRDANVLDQNSVVVGILGGAIITQALQ